MMYVRTKDGKILTSEDAYKETEVAFKSENILEVIVEDDMVYCQFGNHNIIWLQVGARYSTENPSDGWVKGIYTPDGVFWSLQRLFDEDMLKRVVTKEQLDNISFVIGE